jgi:small conductance mechanosensitive channel
VFLGLIGAVSGTLPTTALLETLPTDLIPIAFLKGLGMDSLLPALSEMVVKYGGLVVVALVVLFAGWIFAGWVGRITEKALTKAKIDETLAKFLSKLARFAILLLVILACLSVFGVETTSFAAVLGSAGIAIGLAFQGTLGNFASGMMLLMFRPFQVGDVVKLDGTTGRVNEIELFTTTIDTFDNRRLIIPNGSVFGNTIENISFHSHRRADVAVGVTYSADIDRTREVLTQAAQNVPGALNDPEPSIVLQDLGDSCVNWSVRVWAKSDEFTTVKQAATRAVKLALDKANIEIPFPQLDVRVTNEE